jgi:hypothetical protein
VLPKLEPEVHIIERYLQLVKRWFTMTNVMLDGGKEIDLLALDPCSGNKYHIEVRVAISRGFRIRLVDTQTKSGIKHKRGLDTLNEIKFSPPAVVNSCREIFGCDNYKRVLVVWDVQEPNVIKLAKDLYGIEVWRISDLINDLINEVDTKAYRDDILRTVQLISTKSNTHYPNLKIHSQC